MGVFTPPPHNKKYKNVIFSCFFHFFSYGLNNTFTFLIITICHNKTEKNVLKKKHKKMGKNVFKILFYFSKMDKNKCPKFFLKKKFQKTENLYFFDIFILLSISPNELNYELSLYLSMNWKNEK